MLLGSVALFVGAILFAGYPPLLAMAQQTAPPITTTTTPPLTPQEQEQQNRLQNVIAATNQNLDEAEKQVGGIVYTPRWSNPVWVEANSLAVLFAYCLPGEFAESGQEILGGFELEVLESYEIALAQGFMAWMMVVGNEDRQDRLPAAVGVICASDTNDVETRVISPEEQQQINNVVQQFITTQVTNIEQVINIINNVTVNATTGGPVMPLPTNDTGGGPPTECPTGSFYNSTSGQCEYPRFEILDTTPPVVTVPPSYTVTAPAINPDGSLQVWVAQADDDVDGYVILDLDNTLRQDPVGGDVGGDISISCDPPSGSTFPIGETVVECTATDASGNTGTASFILRVNRPPIESPFLTQEQPPAAADEEEAPVEEEEQPPAATEEEEEAPVEEEQAPPAATEGDEGAP